MGGGVLACSVVLFAMDYWLGGVILLLPVGLAIAYPELAVWVLLREKGGLSHRVVWSDEAVTVVTPDSRSEFTWQAANWFWSDRNVSAVARSVRVKPVFIAVVPHTAFETPDDREDFNRRAQRALASKPRD